MTDDEVSSVSLPTSSATPDPTEGDRPRSHRTLVLALLAAIVLIAGVAAYVMIPSDDEDAARPSSVLVRFDPDASTVQTLDADGAVIDTFDVPDGLRAPPLNGPRGTVLFDSSDDGRVVTVDVSDGSATTYDVPAGLSLERPVRADSTHLVLSSQNGDDVMVVDLADGSESDMADVVGLDPADVHLIRTRVFDGARVYRDATSPNVRSLVVSDDGEAWVVDSGVIDVQGERALGIRVEAGVSLVGIAQRGDLSDEVELASPPVGGMLTNDHAGILVSANGGLVSVDVSASSVVDLPPLGHDVTSTQIVGDDRMLVVGDDSSSFLIDGGGRVVQELEPAIVDGDTEAMVIGPSGVFPGATCMVTQPGSSIRTEDADVVLRDISTGESRATFDVSAGLVDTPDGCTAVTYAGEGTQVALDGTPYEFDETTTVMAIAADLERMVVRGDTSDPELLDVESGDRRSIEMGIYLFVQR